MLNDQPNLLIIQADQRATSALGAYGNAVAKTPPDDAFEPRCLRASKIFSEWACQDSFGFRNVEEDDD